MPQTPPPVQPGTSRDKPADPANEPPPRDATLGQVITAVFWSFFGVRKGEAMQRDAVTIKPLQVVIVGLALGAVFVLTLVLVVRFIISHAS